MPSLKGGVLGGTQDNGNDIYFNPFAESSQTSFTSAVKDARIETRPGFRRRGSEGAAQRSRTDHDPWDDDGAGRTRVHVRASTMDSNPSGATKLRHPLASTGPSKSTGGSSRSSLVDTRPGLKRVLSDLDAGPSQSSRSSEDSLPSSSRSQGVKEMMVVVHEIAPKDSLAGVALKYGISMADLRRANQLWTSDPIHLRKVLYIPLEKAQKAKHLVLSQLEGASQFGSQTDLVDTSAVDGHDNRTLSPPPTSALTVRRIPVSQLSYFPPSSSSHLAVSRSDAAVHTLPRSPRAFTRDSIPFELTPSSSSAYSEASSSSLPPSSVFATALQSQLHLNASSSRSHIPTLTSLLNSLPLPRLSFDSGNSTPTQVSDEPEHELVDVGSQAKADVEERRAHAPRHRDPDLRAAKLGFKGGSAKSNGVELDSYPSPPNLRFSRSLGSGSLRSTPHTPPKQRAAAAYVTPDRHVPLPELVRTSQLEPSPTMQLPLKPRRSRDAER